MFTELYDQSKGTGSGYKPVNGGELLQGMEACNCNRIDCYYCNHRLIAEKHGLQPYQYVRAILSNCIIINK